MEAVPTIEAKEESALQDAAVLGRGAGVSLTGGIAARGLNFGSQIVIARLLGVADFGLYSLGWTLVRIFPSLSTLGLEAGVTYLGAHYLRLDQRRFKGAVRQSITIAFVSGVTLGVVIYLVAPTLADRVFHKPDALPIIRAFSPAFPLYAVLIVGNSITALSHRMQYAMCSNVAVAGATLCLFCVLFLLGCGVIGAVFSVVGGIAIGLIISLCFVASIFPSTLDKRAPTQLVGRELLGYSAPLIISGLASSSLTFVDRLFVASFCTSRDLGIYQAASQVAILFTIFGGAFHGILSPMIADLHAGREVRRVAELYRICVKWALYVAIPAFLVIFFAPGEVVRLFYGTAYVAAATPLVILSLGQIFLITTASAGPTLLMTGQHKTFIAIPVAILPIDVLLTWVLVGRFGLQGAAIAAAASALTLALVAIVAVKISLGIWPFDGRCLKFFVAAAATFVLLFACQSLKIQSSALKLAFLTTVSVMGFFGCLTMLGLDAEDRTVLRLFLRHFSSNALLNG
ncbi:MAG: flippase [Terriglobia bacterium]